MEPNRMSDVLAQIRAELLGEISQLLTSAPLECGRLAEEGVPLLLNRMEIERQDGVLVLRDEGASGAVVMLGGKVRSAVTRLPEVKHGRAAIYTMLAWRGMFFAFLPLPKSADLDTSLIEILITFDEQGGE